MNLHNQIMNICVNNKLREDYTDVDGEVSGEWYAYKEGHHDARHTAAELSLKAEARIEELEETLKGLLNEAHTATKPLHVYSEWSIKAHKLLENK